MTATIRAPMAFALAVPLSLAASCARQEVRGERTSGSSDTATLFVSADMRGYLGPCGCSEAMRGGMDRAAFQVAEGRKASWPVHYLDAGDTLFGRLVFSQAEVAQEERKAKAIADIFRLMGLEAHAVGERDDARGADFRKSLHLPDLANGSFQTLDGGGVKIAVVAARTPDQLIRASKAARASASFVLGFIHQSIQDAQQTATMTGLEADLLVASHGEDEFSAEENRLVRTAIPVVQVQSKGRSLARVDLFFQGGPGQRFELQKSQTEAERELQALDQRISLMKKELNEPGLEEATKKLKQKRLETLVATREARASSPIQIPPGKNAFTVRFIPLESTLPSQPEAKAKIEAYDRDVGLLNLAWAREHGKDCPPAGKREASFVGNQSCRECHADSFPVWEGSKHAHAYRTLANLGKQYHLDCVGCHVTGFGKPGGVCRVDRVQARENVGCESCHGPGSLHVEDPSNDNVLARPRESDCVGCHNPENSTHFNFATYLPQILGPGHGAGPLDGGHLRR